MKTLLGTLFALVAMGVPLLVRAQTDDATKPQAPQNAWQIRTVLFPAGFWWSHLYPAPPCFGPPDKMANVLPRAPLRLPALDAPAREWEDHIRKSSIYIAAYLSPHGILSPEGTLYLYDSATGTLAVRSSLATIDQIEVLAKEFAQKTPMSVVSTLEIVEAEASVIRQALSETTGKSDHSTTWQHLRKLVDEGRATPKEKLRLETRSGQMATTQAGHMHRHMIGVKRDNDGRIDSVRDQRCAGTTFTLEPVILTPFKVDAAITLEHHLSPPVTREAPAGRAGSWGEVRDLLTDFRLVKIHSDITWQGGTTRLLGVWSPHDPAQAAQGEVMQAAFVGMNVTHLILQENKALAGLLEQYGSRVTSTTGLPPPAPPVAAGPSTPTLITRSYRVPPEFPAQLYAIGTRGEVALTDGLTPKSDDPFATPPPGGGSPIAVHTPAAVFGRFGIRFDEGCSMSFVPSTSTFIVRNTEEGLDRIGKLVEQIWDEEPKILSHTLHIVEGEGAVLRQLSDEARFLIRDEGIAWKHAEKLLNEGTLKLRSTVRLDGNKQLVKFECGTMRMSAVDIAKITPGQELEFPTKVRGTRFASDTLLGFHRPTVDLGVELEHDFAPSNVVAAPPLGKVRQEEKFPRGVTKLIGTWKMEGTKELEGKDVMQAAFLRVDVVTVGRE